MAAIFGPGGPIILPWTVRGDRFSGGTVHGVTVPPGSSVQHISQRLSQQPVQSVVAHRRNGSTSSFLLQLTMHQKCKLTIHDIIAS